ncbi:hypothetical protein [Peribacillus frigoritolerans]|uniref:hypothetical protein n=1 Tax=Peribacillus frigoritolerans TaxID=450367 RepID=UPI002EAB1340|nr:hypothetical protein [Peribacillus frigoritolerans]
MATCPTEGVTMYWGEQISPNKVTAHHINKRLRLGAESEDEDGIWLILRMQKQKKILRKLL